MRPEEYTIPAICTKGGSMPMEGQKQKLEIHIVTHERFSRYGWLDKMTRTEGERYYRFQKGSYCVIPNDDPFAIAAIVADTDQTMESDILPAIRGIKRFLKYSRLTGATTGVDNTVIVKFEGFNPSESIKQATLMMMQSLVGQGFTYRLA